MTALGALVGAGLAAGLLLVVTGLVPTDARDRGYGRLDRHRRDQLAVCGALAVAAAGVVGGLTRWPVATAAAGVAGWWSPQMLGRARRALAADTAQMEAIATWTEMLRDGFDSGSFLESTILATEEIAPLPIRAQVGRMCQRLRRSRPGSTEAALNGLAADLADPTADLVVTALLMASKGAAANLAELLSTLAASAREEVNMRLRVETNRAMIRTQRRVILIVIGLFCGYLVVFHRDFLHPYGTPVGQVVLAGVAGLFAVALWMLDRLGRYQPAERNLRPGSAR